MYIGVDIGGTKIALGIVDENANILYRKLISTKKEKKPIQIIKEIAELITNSIEVYVKDNKEVKAVGIGIPGFINKKTGNIIQCVNLDWYDIPLRDILEREINIPVFIDNDASLAALAEYQVGAMKDTYSGIMLTLGTGIGGGIIIDGNIYNGFHGLASEIGHMVIGNNFYDCNCGKNGCFETFASATALKEYTKKLLQEKNTSLVNEMINGNINNLNGQIIFEAALKGDTVANKSIDRLVKYLGVGIVNLINIIDPEIFVIGGGLSKSGPFLLDKIKTEVKENKLIKTISAGDIVFAKLGNEAGIIGAAIFCKSKLSS